MARLVTLLVYLGLFLILQYYARHNPPPPSRRYIEPEVRPAWLLIHWLGPLLLPLVGLLWVGVLPVSPLILLLQATFIPLLVFVLFLSWLRVFSNYVMIALALFSAFIILGTLPFLFIAETSLPLVLLFFISLAIPPALMLLYLMLWAPMILPLPPELSKDRRKILAYVAGFFTRNPKSTWAIIDGKVETRIAGNPFQGTGPGLIVTEPDFAVAVKDSSSIRKVSGPGTLFAEANEQIHDVLDLLQQVRGTKVETLTRDGIRVHVPISSIFRIDAGQEEPTLGRPLPYKRNAALKILFSAEVNPSSKSPLEAHRLRPWEDLPLSIATYQVKQEVAKHDFDDLYGTHEEQIDSVPRGNIGKAVRAKVKEVMEPKGIKIEGGGVGNTIRPVDEEVVKQRVDSWKTHWIQQIMANIGEANVSRQKQLEKVRQEVRTEMLRSILHQSQLLQASKEGSAAILMLQLLETMEHIARDTNVESLLPESAMPSLRSMKIRIAGQVEKES